MQSVPAEADNTWVYNRIHNIKKARLKMSRAPKRYDVQVAPYRLHTRACRVAKPCYNLHTLYVDRIEAFGRFLNFKRDLVVVLKRTDCVDVDDVRVVDKHIFGSVVRGNESKALFGTEPFNCSLWHIGVGVDDCTALRRAISNLPTYRSVK